MNSTSSRRSMQFSIRTALSLVALAALCLAGVVGGPPLTWIGTVLLAVLLAIYAINAAIGRGDTRRFAIGFLIPVSAYLSLTVLVSDAEYATGGGHLPTSRFVQSIMRPKYSGKTMSIGQFQKTLGDVRDTLPLAHLSFAFVFGYAGAFYAVWLGQRETSPSS